jgi:glycosyltransferase involved in cell wall biosynthesis
VAAIVDEFTGLSLAPECELHHLTPDGWEAELTAARPQLLFVESAWRGRDGAWHNTVSRFPAELRSIVRWCTERGVPTVFWNKEDPVHFSTFLTTARAFDHVFTTDLDCVGRYKAALGHDRVHLLPFAAQPRVHHPIEDRAREDAFSFAGAYYRRYPDRTRDLDSFLAHLPALRRVDIFDRNLGSDDVNYTFPDAYRGYVVGTLPPEDVAQAYKGYRFGINLNSVKQSQTMFARRVYELLASNTVTVSNFSRGVRVLFGDLVVTTDSGAEAVRRLTSLADDEDRLDRHRLAGLRSVMSQHTYADRLATVMAAATGAEVPDPVPPVALVGHARTGEEAERLLAAMRRQAGVRWRGILLVDRGVDVGYQDGVTVLRAEAVWDDPAADLLGAAELVGVLHPDDYYGPHYVLDLALGTRYSDAAVLGKQGRYRAEGAGLRRVNPGAEYRRAGRLPVRCSLVRTAALRAGSLGALVGDVTDGLQPAGLDQVSLDRFGYCQGGRDGAGVAAAVDDLDLWTGVPLADLQRAAEATAPAELVVGDLPTVGWERLATWFSRRRRPAVSHGRVPGGWRISSTLDDDAYDYVYAASPVPVQELWAGDRAEAYLDTTPGLRLQLVFVFLDQEDGRLGNFFVPPAQHMSARIPAGAVAVRVGIRVAGPGSAVVRRLVLGHVRTRPGAVVPTTRDLVVSNLYPTYGNLYRNAFVHTRVQGYRERGLRAEVFRVRPDQEAEYDEYESVDVVTGGDAELRGVLAGGRHRSVMVHFLDRTMWSVLRELTGSVRVVVWVHGFDVQPWWRRRFVYDGEEDIRRAQEASEERMGFWREVFGEAGPHVHFVFVSQYLAETAFADVGVALDPGRYSVIHNPIDVDLFAFRPKDPDQRLRVLSIRPFASTTYANDLTVAAVLRLSREPWFEELEFRIVGDGPLFEETVAPIRSFPNVQLEQRFLTQREIAVLHREYGVFLVPTRMDTHGVSRDEAMSSGLVPVSTAVGAVPEFVDDDSGILVPGEDAEALAAAVARLRADPDLFLRLSAGAADRVRRQSARADVLDDELRVLRGTAG